MSKKVFKNRWMWISTSRTKKGEEIYTVICDRCKMMWTFLSAEEADVVIDEHLWHEHRINTYTTLNRNARRKKVFPPTHGNNVVAIESELAKIEQINKEDRTVYEAFCRLCWSKFRFYDEKFVARTVREHLASMHSIDDGIIEEVTN